MTTSSYTITRRIWSSLPPITVQIGAEFASSPDSIKLGAAVKVFVAAERSEGRAADLTRAVLTDAVLTRADLTGADLTGAVLTRAVLTGAVLTGADLTRAVLTDAVLTRADLTGAVLTDAVLTGAVLTRAVLTDADLSAAVPVVPHLDAQILAAIGAGGSLDMSSWHTCDTTHCRAGWAITLAGDAGRELEASIGPAAAGALIYAVSRPGERVPDFYSNDGDALADLKAGAERDPMPAVRS